MMNVHTAASCDYYLGRTGQSEALGVGQKEGDGFSYYNKEGTGLGPDDPLAKPGIWGGRFAASLGLAEGSTVSPEDFRNMMFGHDPRTGKPLHDGIASKEEQAKADRERNRLEREEDSARRALWKAREEAARMGGLGKDDPAVTSASIALKEAEERRKAYSNKSANDGALRQQAHDLTFSSPKSVSCLKVMLMAEGRGTDAAAAESRRRAAELDKAMDDAVMDTLRHIESELPLARPRDPLTSQRSFQPMRGIAFALFGHSDARPVDSSEPDPEDHRHAVLMSVGMGHDGEMRALWTKYLSQNAQTLGARFRANHAARLSALGYDIVPEIQDKVVSFRLAGMEREDALKFSRRSEQIEEARGNGLSAAAAKVAGRKSKHEGSTGHTFLDANQRRLIDAGFADSSAIAGSHAARLEKARANAHERLKREWVAKDWAWRSYSENPSAWPKGKPVPERPPKNRPPETPAPEWATEESERKNAEAWALRVERDARAIIEADKMPPSDADGIIHACLEMDTSFGVPDIERRIEESLQFAGALGPQELDALRRQKLEECLSHPDLVQVSDGALCADGLDQAGMPRFTTKAQREGEIELHGSLLPRLMDARDRMALSRDEALLAISAWERKKGAGLAENQRAAAVDMLTNSAGMQIAQGFAGAGKTFMADCVFNTLKAGGARLYAMAPSNSAALLLKNEIGAEESFTPESLLSRCESAGADKVLDKNTILYIDESSMLDFRETLELVRLVDQAGAKIVFSGDQKQLLSVGAGNVYKRMMTSALERQSREEHDGTRLVTFLNEGFKDHDTIQRQKRSAGRQVVAWCETCEAVRALDAMDRRGWIRRCASGHEKVEAAADDRTAQTPDIRLADIFEAQRSLPKGSRELSKARAELRSALEQVSRHHRSHLVVAETRKEVAALNAAIRERLKAKGLLGTEEHEFGGTKLALGDRLMLTEKATRRDVVFDDDRKVATKGTVGTVYDIRKTVSRSGKVTVKARLLLDDGTKVLVDSSFAGGVQHAYAMTAHRAQGQTADHVVYCGTPRSSANLFLVGVSRFKETLRVYALHGEFEGLKTSIAREQKKVDATERGAAEYNLFETGDVADYLAEAKALAEKADMAEKAMGAAELRGAARERLVADAERAVRMARAGIASRVAEAVSERVKEFARAQRRLPPDESAQGHADALAAAAKERGYTLDRTLELGIARRTGSPDGDTQPARGNAAGERADAPPATKETLYGYARKIIDRAADAGRLLSALGNRAAGSFGGDARDQAGAGLDGRAPETGALKAAGGPGRGAVKVGDVPTLPPGPMASGQQDGGVQLPALLPSIVDPGSPLIGQKHGDDPVRRAAGRRPQGAAQKGPSGDAARRDWEWLAVSGDDVLARNLRSGQVEAWSARDLRAAGRVDLVEAALSNMGRLGKTEEKAPAATAEGWIVEIGESHFRGDTAKRKLPHVVVEAADGSRKTLWGVKIADACAKAGVGVGDWARLDNAERETVELPTLDPKPGDPTTKARVSKDLGKGRGVMVETEEGKRVVLLGEEAETARAAGAGAELTLGFRTVSRTAWGVRRAEPQNPISPAARESAAQGVLAFIEDGSNAADGALAAMGLDDRESALRLWVRTETAIRRWDAREGGSQTWESLGTRTGGDGGARRFLAYVMHSDAEYAYCACATGGKDGAVEDAHDRIVAIPLSDMPSGARKGTWAAFLVSRDTGLRQEDSGRCALAAEAGDAKGAMLASGDGRPLADGSPALHCAARAGMPTLCVDLLSKGANIEETDRTGRTALHVAAEAGRPEAAETLLSAGANPNARTSEGDTPLHFSARNLDGRTGAALVRAGADSTAKNNEGTTAAMCAITGAGGRNAPLRKEWMKAVSTAQAEANTSRTDAAARRRAASA